MSTLVNQGHKGKIIDGSLSAVSSATGVPMIISDENLLQQNLFPAWNLGFSLGNIFNDADEEEDKEHPTAKDEKGNPNANQQFVLLIGAMALVGAWLLVR